MQTAQLCSGHTKKAPAVNRRFCESTLKLSLRQHVFQADVSHHQVSILRRSCRHKPWRARDVRRLRNQQYGAVLRVFPEGLRPIDGAFLDSAVVGVGRVGSAEADKRLGGRGSGDVRESIALVVEAAVVETEQALFAKLEFRSHNSGACVDHGEPGITAHRTRSHNCACRS
jgi:hypothetical protein